VFSTRDLASSERSNAAVVAALAGERVERLLVLAAAGGGADVRESRGEGTAAAVRRVASVTDADGGSVERVRGVLAVAPESHVEGGVVPDLSERGGVGGVARAQVSLELVVVVVARDRAVGGLLPSVLADVVVPLLCER
jgi:hypothetical protein